MVSRSLLHLVLVIAAACGHNPPASDRGSGASTDQKHAMQQLTIVTGPSRHVMDTGYGVVYQAPVAKILEGELADREIALRLLPNPDGALYSGQFRNFEAPPATLRFSPLPSDALLYEGFRAADGTAWKLVSVAPE